LLVAGGSAGGESEQKAEAVPEKAKRVAVGELVSPEDSLSHIRYFEGNQVSLNNRCPVRKVALNPKMPPVYVNGRPVGFC
jgi:hypothetical protein